MLRKLFQKAAYMLSINSQAGTEKIRAANQVDADIAKRAAAKAAMPMTALDAVHTENCRVLPDRRDLLRHLPKGGIAAEIGAAFGDFSKEIFALNQPAQLHLIDAWETQRYRKGLDQIKDDLADKIAAEALVIHQGYSTERLAECADDFFDWVYIDTNHTYETTYQELVLSAQKTKPQGLIAGHDFCTGNIVKPVLYGVVQAVNEFCVKHGWQYRYITLESHGHFSFCLSRIRPS